MRTYFMVCRSRRAHAFRALIKVNGVGPKVALCHSLRHGRPSVCALYYYSDVGALTRIPGIGKKTAERLVVEMQDRLPQHSPARRSILEHTGRDSKGGPAFHRYDRQLPKLSNSDRFGYKPREAAKPLVR